MRAWGSTMNLGKPRRRLQVGRREPAVTSEPVAEDRSRAPADPTNLEHVSRWNEAEPDGDARRVAMTRRGRRVRSR